MKKETKARLLKFPKILYTKLVKIHDSPQRIALGLGLGVFAGITPGIGPLTAIFLALIFRANRAAALLGSLLTNTWLSFLTFILSIKVGSVIMGLDWYKVHKDWVIFLKGFYWLGLFKVSVFKILLPVIVGYLAIALGIGLVTYLVTLAVLKLRR